MKAMDLARIAPLICIVVAAGSACAQNFPTKPIRIVTSPAGGDSDFISRLLSQGLTVSLNQPVIVDNRGGGVIPIEAVSKAPSDGYTLLYYGSGFWVNPLLEGGSPDDRLRILTPVSIAVSQSNIVTIHPSLPVKSIKELIALAKAKPGAINYATTSVGSSSHMAAELFKALAGVDMLRVPYKGTGPALNAILGGEVSLLMAPAGGTAPHIKSGKIRALAVTGAKRSAAFPDLPTVAQSGLPGYEYGQMAGVFAPAKTAVPIVDQLSKEISRVISSAEVKQKLLVVGTDAEGTTPQEALAKIKSEVARLGKVIKESNIRAEN